MNLMKNCYLDRHVSWSELPSELLASISKRLDTHVDILNFRGVCTTWRSSTPLSLIKMKSILSTFFPMQFPNDPTEMSHVPRVLLKSSVLLLQSATNPDILPYLLFIEEFNPGKLSFRYPLTDDVEKSLHNGFPNTLDMSQFIVLELGTFVTMNYLVGEYSYNPLNMRNKNGRFPTRHKAVLFFDPYCKTQPSINECSVVEMSKSISLYVTRLGSMEKHKVTFKGRKLEDIVNFNDKIYAIDRTGRVCCMDYHSLKMVSVAEDSVCAGAGPEGRKYLAATPDALFLIYCWWKKYQPAFKIFKLNEAEERWDYVNGIGQDRILFINSSGCFFASTQNFPGWGGNCIAFPAGSFHPYSGPCRDHTIFQTRYRIHHQDFAIYQIDCGSCFIASSKPLYSKVVKPPPSWLWINPSSDTGGRIKVKEEEQYFEITKDGQYEIV